jgi:hypothetical protein
MVGALPQTPEFFAFLAAGSGGGNGSGRLDFPEPVSNGEQLAWRKTVEHISG